MLSNAQSNAFEIATTEVKQQFSDDDDDGHSKFIYWFTITQKISSAQKHNNNMHFDAHLFVVRYLNEATNIYIFFFIFDIQCIPYHDDVFIR